jgi:DNA repair photolyase
MTEISEYFSKIGERGGSAGRGASKRRGHVHYAKMVENRNINRELRRLENMPLIYTPNGKAREYSPLALNVYNGCDHGCTYCYAPLIRRDMSLNKNVHMRDDFLIKLEKELLKSVPKEQILLSFMCDPYSHFDAEHKLTRSVVEYLNLKKCKVAVLTKGGSRCLRDLDVFKRFGGRLKVGATLTFMSDSKSLSIEPDAALPQDRLNTLKILHENDIKTWVSIEPVIDPEESLSLIKESIRFVDQYKIGKMNHFEKRFNPDIDWKKFMIDSVTILRESGKQFYVKEDLREFDNIEFLLPHEKNMNSLNL